jgi:hypothetical protein
MAKMIVIYTQPKESPHTFTEAHATPEFQEVQ